MSNSAVNNPAYPAFVRRRIGRAPSPPTWACYEQIPFDDEYSDSGSEDNSCSEDEEDYGRAVHPGSDVSDGDPHAARENGHALPAGDDIGPDEGDEAAARKIAEYKKDVKGKQRAIEPEPEPESPRRQHRKKRRQPVFTLRPILTIQRSQGFVWNQDLFVPPYIKDRYVASTSPPNVSGFVSAPTAPGMDYEVEVVEIRVKEGELNDIIP
ncbi:hypothetical protein POSPLADRAFT_1041225 [Postia placenta MAD-698-R-SB12]|uniref:Uncharacterized protein n=1 Tax=Postia placenta MAD-698-R-SB12 TaxID=670580 RepID=A0A1X6MRL7_9APHY|nr:hypothetical protein POSPLADRAFT_1041225 [Postia placenta MAD-698-R-SB12]OSX59021.1 hypothetical protein POSPLADRAFT_1041225 [Postia placenta MAD-698-R-SB12]